jgi:hypothetical protein
VRAGNTGRGASGLVARCSCSAAPRASLDPARALQLLRQQVQIASSNAFKAAAALASVPGATNATAAERAYQVRVDGT